MVVWPQARPSIFRFPPRNITLCYDLGGGNGLVRKQKLANQQSKRNDGHLRLGNDLRLGDGEKCVILNSGHQMHQQLKSCASELRDSATARSAEVSQSRSSAPDRTSPSKENWL